MMSISPTVANIIKALADNGVPSRFIVQAQKELPNTNLNLAQQFLVLGGAHAFTADAAELYADRNVFVVVDLRSLCVIG